MLPKKNKVLICCAALIAEVKRNSKQIRLCQLKEKASKLKRQLKGYSFEYVGLSLDDLVKFKT